MKRDCPDRKKNKDDENEDSSKFANVVEDNSDNADGDMLSVASNSEHLPGARKKRRGSGSPNLISSMWRPNT